MIIVARGGGSLADLFAFCDETLCRTVALLRVPVIASVGHHTDRTLIDDVAAVSCSTPTHAAEAAVPVDCAARPRSSSTALAARLERQGRRAIVERARTLARLSRAPASHVARHRTRLHQHLRELRASARRGARRRAPDRGRGARPCSSVAPRPRGSALARGARRARTPTRRRWTTAAPPPCARRARDARAAPARARRPRPAAHAGARLRAGRGREGAPILAAVARAPPRLVSRAPARLTLHPARRGAHLS